MSDESRFSSEELEDFFVFWNEVVPRKFSSSPESNIPPSLNYEELCDRLEVPFKEDRISDGLLLDLAKRVINLAPDTPDLHLIQASYLYLVFIHAPWAMK
jgi:hypothetical protein